MMLPGCLRLSASLLVVGFLLLGGCGGGDGGNGGTSQQSGAQGTNAPATTETPSPSSPTIEMTGTGGTEASTGGTEASTGGTDASTGATGASTGGTEASTGGTEASTSGTEASTGGTEASTGETGASTGGTENAYCPENLEFDGQIGADPENEHHGGTPTSERYTNDSGIANLLAAAPTTPGEEVSGLSLDIEGATVTAVVAFRENRQFWIEDAGGAIVFFLPPEGVPDFGPVAVGQKISLTVNTLFNFNGTPEITGASNWQLDGTDNPVYIADKTGEAIPIGMLGQLVRVTGVITEDLGPCGGSSKCYTLEHGGETITLRTAEDAAVCDCLTYVGPVGQFNGTAQLDAVDFDFTTMNETGPGNGEFPQCEGGGTEASTGGTDASTGATGASTGGTEASTGGTEASTSGTEASTGGTEASTGETGASTGGTENAYCPENLEFDGQIGADPENEHHGGTPTSERYTNDSGIANLLAAAPTTPGEEVSGLSLDIEGATVTAVVAFRENRQFWIEDAGGAIVFFLPPEGVPDFGPVAVGQKISLTVNTLFNFNGTPEITGASNWQLDGTDNPVYIADKTGEAIPIGMLGQLVRVTGVITEDLGPCGGSSKCYTLEHGGETITLRTAEDAAVCDCLTYVGPVGQFNGTAQLDAVDFDFTTMNETGPGNGEFPQCEGGGTEASTGGTDASTGETGASTGEPTAPPIVINEIMYDPGKVRDNQGEYIELFNTSDQEISITNWKLVGTDAEGGAVTHTISSVTPLTIPPGGFFVLGVNARPSRNGGVTVNYEYGPDISLSNSGGDYVILKDPDDIVIDRIDYKLEAPWPPHKIGFAIELRDPFLDNDDGTNWGNATQTYGDGDHGTPGNENQPE